MDAPPPLVGRPSSPSGVSEQVRVAVPVLVDGSVPLSVQGFVSGSERRPAPGSDVEAESREAARRAVLSHPEALHPTLWLGHQLGRHAESVVPSGFAALDAQLPGGGWPRRALSELLLPHAGIGEIRLLSLCLARVQREGGLVMLFDPPSGLSATALSGLGIDLEALLIVTTRARVIPGTDSLWAMEQALKSGHVGALVGWLPPRLRAERLRRLQLAAHAHDGPAFVMRETSAEQRPTSAPLRLVLKAGGADVLEVRVSKRRGPPLERPIRLALPEVLSSRAQVRAAMPPHTPELRRAGAAGPPLRSFSDAGAGEVAPHASMSSAAPER